jgi:ATP-binding cassette subfamily B protein AbcA/BmrA
MNMILPPKARTAAAADGRGGGGGAAAAARSKLSDLRFVIGQVAQPTRLVTLAVAISIGEMAATLLSPLLTKSIVDEMSGADGQWHGSGFSAKVVYLLLALVAGGVAAGISSFLLSKAGLQVTSRLKATLVARILRHPVSEFDARETGDYVSRISNDVGVIAKLITGDLHGLILGCLLLVGSLTVLCFLDLQLTMVIFGVIVAAFLAMAPGVIRLARITKDINDSTALLSSSLVGVLREARLIKAYTAEDQESRRSEETIEELYRSNLKSSRIRSVLAPITSVFLSAAIVAILVYGGARVGAGTLRFGTLTAFILYIFNIVGPMLQLSMFLSGFQSAKGSAVRLREILETRDESAAEARPDAPCDLLDLGPQSLTFSDVLFRYEPEGRTRLVLDEFVIPAGESTAIVGPSGSGKTSLLGLIERFYEPESGAIRWGGTNIRAYPLSAWRQAIGYVPQNAPLLSGSIRSNIEYGTMDRIGDERLRDAAAAADCLAFIEDLPAGFDSEVGEAGVRLSGGQRQRIAIARAFLRDPRLLLLDEATSNLDGTSEEAVLRALRRLMVGRTTIVVTHRLTALADVDNIAIIEGGRLIEMGRRSEILDGSAYFRKMRHAVLG